MVSYILKGVKAKESTNKKCVLHQSFYLKKIPYKGRETSQPLEQTCKKLDGGDRQIQIQI